MYFFYHRCGFHLFWGRTPPIDFLSVHRSKWLLKPLTKPEQLVINSPSAIRYQWSNVDCRVAACDNLLQQKTLWGQSNQCALILCELLTAETVTTRERMRPCTLNTLMKKVVQSKQTWMKWAHTGDLWEWSGSKGSIFKRLPTKNHQERDHEMCLTLQLLFTHLSWQSKPIKNLT